MSALTYTISCRSCPPSWDVITPALLNRLTLRQSPDEQVVVPQLDALQSQVVIRVTFMTLCGIKKVMV